jgi:hypothetical protein
MFSEASAELTVVVHAALAFVLGWTIGYERFYNGRAAGTQVYCLVCTASCALTSAAGLAGHWFGTRQLIDAVNSINCMQVIASLLTGIGFLGAGSKAAIAVRLRYREGERPHTDEILSFLGERSLVPHSDSVSVTFDGGKFSLDLIVSGRASRGRTLNWVVEDLPGIQSIESFTVTRASRT